jgi:hypothetical protein
MLTDPIDCRFVPASQQLLLLLLPSHLLIPCCCTGDDYDAHPCVLRIYESASVCGGRSTDSGHGTVVPANRTDTQMQITVYESEEMSVLIVVSFCFCCCCCSVCLSLKVRIRLCPASCHNHRGGLQRVFPAAGDDDEDGDGWRESAAAMSK